MSLDGLDDEGQIAVGRFDDHFVFGFLAQQRLAQRAFNRDFAQAWRPGESLNRWLNSLPRILAGKDRGARKGATSCCFFLF